MSSGASGSLSWVPDASLRGSHVLIINCTDGGFSAESHAAQYKLRKHELSMATRITRKEGRFGMGHDEENRIIVVHPGSAAADCGLQVGDWVRRVDGVALEGLLTTTLTGKESVVLHILRKATGYFELLDLRHFSLPIAQQEPGRG